MTSLTWPRCMMGCLKEAIKAASLPVFSQFSPSSPRVQTTCESNDYEFNTLPTCQVGKTVDNVPSRLGIGACRQRDEAVEDWSGSRHRRGRSGHGAEMHL